MSATNNLTKVFGKAAKATMNTTRNATQIGAMQASK
jgi:hypothetical protein